MHEFSIVSSLLDLVEADVRKHNAKAATRVVLVVVPPLVLSLEY